MKRYALLICAGLMTACGGGGGGGSSAPPPVTNPPPPPSITPSTPLVLNVGNAERAAGAATGRAGRVFQLASYAAAAIDRANEVRSDTAAPANPIFDCRSNTPGTQRLSFTDNDSSIDVSTNDVISIELDRCGTFHMLAQATGIFTVTVTSAALDPMTMTTTYTATVDATALVFSSSTAEPSRLLDTFSITYVRGDTVRDLTAVGSVDVESQVNAVAITESLLNFEIRKVLDLEAATYETTMRGTVRNAESDAVGSELIVGQYDFELTTPMTGFFDVGALDVNFRLTGASGSVATATSTPQAGNGDALAVTIAVDETGNGNFVDVNPGFPSASDSLFNFIFRWYPRDSRDPDEPPSNRLGDRPNDFYVIELVQDFDGVVSGTPTLEIQLSEPVDPNALPTIPPLVATLDPQDPDNRYDWAVTVAGARVFYTLARPLERGRSYELNSATFGFQNAAGDQAGQTVNLRWRTINDVIARATAAEIFAFPGDVLVLDGTQSVVANDPIASFDWQQQSGTTVSLSGAQSASASFTVPAIAAPETLIFELTITDQLGGFQRQSIEVYVFPDLASFSVFELSDTPGTVPATRADLVRSAANGTFSFDRQDMTNRIEIEHVGFAPEDGLRRLFLQDGLFEEITVGVYDNVSFADDGNKLRLSTERGSCSSISGQFEVFEIVYSGARNIDQLALDFDIVCDGKPLRGYVRKASNWPRPQY